MGVRRKSLFETTEIVFWKRKKRPQERDFVGEMGMGERGLLSTD